MKLFSIQHDKGYGSFMDLLWIFYVFVLSCVCYVYVQSVYICFVVTYWERADFSLVCGV